MKKELLPALVLLLTACGNDANQLEQSPEMVLSESSGSENEGTTTLEILEEPAPPF